MAPLPTKEYTSTRTVRFGRLTLNSVLRRIVGERAVGCQGVRGPPGVLPVAIEERTRGVG